MIFVNDDVAHGLHFYPGQIGVSGLDLTGNLRAASPMISMLRKTASGAFVGFEVRVVKIGGVWQSSCLNFSTLWGGCSRQGCIFWQMEQGGRLTGDRQWNQDGG
jgi:hypothetical protein